MRFVIDEASWHFDGLAQHQCVESLETMLDQLDNALEQGHVACYSDELFNTPVYQGKCFYDLYDPSAPLQIPRDVQERMASIFSGLSKWQEFSTNWPASYEIEIDGGPKEVAISIAWAHEQAFQNPPQYIACLLFPGIRQSGYFDVVVNTKKTSLWFVAENQSYCNFFRWLIIETTRNPAEMEKLAPSAFSDIDFVTGAFNGIKKMSKAYRELVNPLVRHLGVMSDHGKRIFLGPRAQATALFGSLGVDVSDENGNTKENSVARKERTIEIDGVPIIFWWHSKLEPHQDRIHFNPDKINVGGRLLVGIFCSHL